MILIIKSCRMCGMNVDVPSIPVDVEERIGKSGIIAVLVIDDVEAAVPLAKTLRDNGISSIELTLRTESAMESGRRILAEVPEITVGIGTILNTVQVDEVKAAGATFGVAPGYNPAVVERAREKGLPFGPGIAIPSEIEAAIARGCRVLKYFHAEGMGGASYLKRINAPYSFLGPKYIPLGGLKPENIRGYLEMPEILALGGSWIAPADMIRRRNWVQIARNASDAVKILREVRG